MRVPLGHHPGQVLRRQLLARRVGLAGRGERGQPRVRRGRRDLDAGVRVALVVVADEQRVVVAVQRAGDRAQPDVRGAAVPGHHDDVRVRAGVAALADHGLVARGHARGERPAAGDRRVRPRHGVRGAQVGGVGHVHAAGRARHHGVGAGRLEHPAVLDGRPAPRAGPVPGLIRVLVGQVRQVVTVAAFLVVHGVAAAALVQQGQVLAGHFIRHQNAPRASWLIISPRIRPSARPSQRRRARRPGPACRPSTRTRPWARSRRPARP